MYQDLEQIVKALSFSYEEHSSLWKRVIAWERSLAASAYGIIWGDAGQNKHGGI